MFLPSFLRLMFFALLLKLFQRLLSIIIILSLFYHILSLFQILLDNYHFNIHNTNWPVFIFLFINKPASPNCFL